MKTTGRTFRPALWLSLSVFLWQALFPLALSGTVVPRAPLAAGHGAHHHAESGAPAQTAPPKRAPAHAGHPHCVFCILACFGAPTPVGGPMLAARRSFGQRRVLLPRARRPRSRAVLRLPARGPPATP